MTQFSIDQIISDEGDVDALSEKIQGEGNPLVVECHRIGYTGLVFIRFTEANPDNILLLANINYNLPSELLFTRYKDTDLYFKYVEVPHDSKFEYRIIDDDPLTPIFAGPKYSTRMDYLSRHPDPLSKNIISVEDGLGEGIDYHIAFVDLAGGYPTMMISDQVPSGFLVDHTVTSEILGYDRNVSVYLPPKYQDNGKYHLMILLDGSSYIAVGKLQEKLDSLIYNKKIPPTVVLFVDAATVDGNNLRNTELTCNPEFAQSMAEELIPWLEDQYSLTEIPSSRIIAGSSFGGLFAAYFAFEYPTLVTNVLSQSGSFHWGKENEGYGYEWLVQQFAFKPKREIYVWMEVGKLEGEYHWYLPDFPNQIVSHRHFTTILEMKGYTYTYREFNGGHDMISWSEGIVAGLVEISKYRKWGEPT